MAMGGVSDPTGLDDSALARVGPPRSWVVASRLGQARWMELARFAVVTIQLGILALVIYQFRIENRAFSRDLMLIVLGGFVVHHLLPRQYRLPFFFLLSLLAIGVVFGALDGAWTIGLGLALIGICHLPLAFRWRIALMAVTGLTLAVMRAGLLAAPWSTAIWPVVGSMFMFRLIVYLYDLRHEKGPSNPWRTLSYFFLLPNVCFPLFPVVDYGTFKRSYYSDDEIAIYQRGLQWILRGVIQLLLYRLIDAYMLSPDDIASPIDLAVFFVSTFLLYLRVSGQFHVIIGLLHLFGFRLPETHNLYVLSSSFSDFWRRINIYWKDFVMKLFFNPTYFAMRKRGTRTTLTISVLVTFFATWLLHSYQWFWLRGSLLLSWPDVLFWSILAALLIANTLYEHAHGRTRTLGRPTLSLQAVVRRALQTAATFASVCILWSLWGSTSVTEWLLLWTYADPTWESVARLLLAVLAGIIVFGALGAWAMWRGTTEASRPRPTFQRAALMTGAPAFALLAAGYPAVTAQLVPTVQEMMAVAQAADLNRRDAALLQRGYYEDLVGVKSFNSRLWDVYMRRPSDWPAFYNTEAAHLTGDFRKYEVRPSVSLIYHNAPLHTNRWGMRDQEYAQHKPAGTYRIALLGSSQVMGSGVANDETFESILEARLNAELGGAQRYEILNFAVPGWDPLQQVAILDRVFSFEPDAIYFVGHRADLRSSVQHLAEAVRDRVDIPYDDLIQIARDAQINASTLSVVAEKRLKPFGFDVQTWAYRRVAEESQARNVEPVYVLLATLEDSKPAGDDAQLLTLAREAGFGEVLDLSAVYVGQDVSALKVADWDWHPNASGHRLIAARLYEVATVAGLLPSSSAQGASK
ncbi:MAG: hypothetical protein IT305_29005 [Chloroflexi bacterium]|nr:hypothetical protein [Chloroflexota bacterium]